MRDDLELLLMISRWQRAEATRLSLKIDSVMDRTP